MRRAAPVLWLALLTVPLAAYVLIFQRVKARLRHAAAGQDDATLGTDRSRPVQTGFRSVDAGPFTTVPKRSNRDPWQGQSQVLSAGFHFTMQPRWVHAADISWKCHLFASRYTATFLRPRRRTAPLSGWISLWRNRLRCRSTTRCIAMPC